MAGKGRAKTGGRQKGTPNKVNRLLKDAIILAAENAGGGDLVCYLTQQAHDNPVAFMSLLGKVLPMQDNMEADIEPIKSVRITFISPEGELIC